jgi:hypothetical protein
MFLKKKQKELGDQLAVFREREAPRYVTNGSILIAGYEGEGLLKNISVTGCCLESVTYIAIVPDKVYQVTIVPAANIKLTPFTLNMIVTWTKSSEMSFETGFSIENDQKNTQMERYVELLQMQGVKPEYGNMKQ